ncbi:MAG: hypothetical protein Q7S58_14980 [Candidatus Binatus sp.]|uniref:hypothetical protein n=1 Tax=Candidatus Binatus sp. TaxID=2811406 RepID=UPI0027186232|nr:hypothetical protein [Candidatus Binatus sp.]MDO8433706.1 hypothetical protein [Candidatus Binatus sp.]
MQTLFFSYDFCGHRDESLEESDNRLDPDVLPNLEAAVEQFREIATDLSRWEIDSKKS